MPTLKQVTCSIELGPDNTTLKEYKHRFTDGGVEAFVAVPEANVPFQIHIKSNGYIAPGLAAYLFIDGQYQCNRNRQNLSTPAPGTNPRDYEIDFTLRQREEKTAEGLFVARDWTFSRLQKGNADMAPHVNPHFAKNVGTIEVVLLRCKGGDLSVGSAELIDSTGAPVGEYQQDAPARASSVAKAPTAYADKAPSRVASQVSNRKSSKKASEAGGGDMFGGGLMGLFDGAGDHPGYGSYTPRYARDPLPSPGYRDYRDHRHDPRPYTVHGGHGYGATPRHNPRNIYDPRSRTGADHYPAPSPTQGFEYPQRRRYEEPYPQQMARTPAMDRVVYSGPQQQQQRAPEGFQFIRELCQQVDDLVRLQFGERQKLNNMVEEAHMNRHDPEVHLAAVKAARAKEQTLGSLQQETNALFASLLNRMNRMDEAGWNYVRDYVVLERRLVPMSHPDFQQWQDPRQQLPSRQTSQMHQQQVMRQTPSVRSAQHSAGRDQGWEEVGQGQLGAGGAGRLQQMQMQKVQQVRNRQNVQGPSGNNNPGIWDNVSPDDIDQQAYQSKQNQQGNNQQENTWGNDNTGNGNDQQWGDNNSQNNQGGNNDNWDKQSDRNNQNDQNNGGGGWGNDQGGSDNNNNNDAGWSGDNNNNNNDNANNDSGGDNNNDNGGDAWGGNDDNKGKSASQSHRSNRGQSQQGGNWGGGNAGGDDWGGGDKAKSQTASQKIGGWNNNGGGGGDTWNNVQKPASNNGGGGGWGGSKSASKHPSRHSHRHHDKHETTTVLEPVIKSYWADWDKPNETSSKLRARAREPYQYPAMPPPYAATDKASSVNYGVQIGKGANYAHQTHRPDYLDTMERPYAIFTFKYRSKRALERILKREIDTVDVDRAVRAAEKRELMNVPKDELVSNLLRMKVEGGGSRSGGQAPAKSSSRAASNNARGKPASNRPASNNNGWGNGGGDGQGGWDGGNDEVKPQDSASQGGWEQAENKQAGSRKSKSKRGGDDGWNEEGGGVVDWNNNQDQKAPLNGNAGGDWGNGDNNNNGGGGEWGQAQADNKTEAHFGEDQNLQTTGW